MTLYFVRLDFDVIRHLEVAPIMIERRLFTFLLRQIFLSSHETLFNDYGLPQDKVHDMHLRVETP